MYTVDWGRLLARVPHETRSEPRVSPVVWALGFTSLFTDVSSEMVSSILPVYLVLYLRVSPLAFGVVDGFYQGFAMLFRVGAGLAGDRWRRHKEVATLGYALSAACRLAMLAAGSAWTGIAAVVAADRAAKGIRTAPRDALIALNSAGPGLARAFGVHRALDAAGAMLGPLVAFVLLLWLPGRFDVIFVAGFCIAVVGVGIIVLFVEGSRATAADGESRPILAAVGELGRDQRFVSTVTAAGLLSLVTMSDAFVFLALQQQVDFNGGLFPLLFVAVALVNLACAVPGGRLADRIGRIEVFLAGHVLLLCVYGAILVPLPGGVRLGLSLLLLGGYYAATDGVLAAMTGALLPRTLCGSGLAVLATVTNLGRLLASVLFGVAWHSWGLELATAFFAVALVCALIGAAVMCRANVAVGAPSHAV